MLGPINDDIAIIYYGEASQSVVHVPPVRVATATFTISDLTYGEDDSARTIGTANSAATLDSYDQTTTAACGPSQTDPRKITVTTSGIQVGNVYELADASGDGVTTLVRIVGTGSGYVKTSAPIPTDFASGATLKGVQLSASFPDATAADSDYIDADRPLHVRWEYTAVDGRKWIQAQQVRVERRGATDVEHARVEMWIREGWYDLIRELPDDATTLRNWVNYADRKIRARMMGRNVKPGDFAGGPQYQDLLQLRTLLHMASQGFHPKNRDPELFYEERKDEYVSAWNALFVGNPGKNTIDMDRSTDGALAEHGAKYRPAFGIA